MAPVNSRSPEPVSAKVEASSTQYNLANEKLGHSEIIESIKRKLWASLLVAGSLSFAGCGSAEKPKAPLKPPVEAPVKARPDMIARAPQGFDLKDMQATEDGVQFKKSVKISNVERLFMQDKGNYSVLINENGELVPYRLYKEAEVQSLFGIRYNGDYSFCRGVTAKLVKDAPQNDPMYLTIEARAHKKFMQEGYLLSLAVVVHVHQASQIQAANFETERTETKFTGPRTKFKPQGDRVTVTVRDPHTNVVIE